ncbi:MAG: hypothetical protein KDA87_02330 [Planctomycetales bacterium]|nr:hypothetical protein [Planctomycetales bacterium]
MNLHYTMDKDTRRIGALLERLEDRQYLCAQFLETPPELGVVESQSLDWETCQATVPFGDSSTRVETASIADDFASDIAANLSAHFLESSRSSTIVEDIVHFPTNVAPTYLLTAVDNQRQLAVWLEPSSRSATLHGQLFQDGLPLSDAYMIADVWPALLDDNPAVSLTAVPADNGTRLIWSDFQGIHLIDLDANGFPKGEPNLLVSSRTAFVAEAQLWSSGLRLVWFDQVANAIVQQRFDANSNPVTDIERLQSVRADRAVTSIQIQPHEDGAFSIVWTEQTTRPTDPEASSFLALFDQDGVAQSSLLEVGDSISRPAHWFDAGTSHTVLVRSEQTETSSQLWLDRYDANLNLVSQSFVTETSDIPFAHPLRIAQTESGTFWLTYFDQTDTGLSLFAIHLGADSLPIGITQLNDDASVHPAFAQIHAATDDSVSVSWISDDPLIRGRQLQLRTAISTYTKFEYQYATDESTTAFATLELSDLPSSFAVADAERTDQQTWEVPFNQYALIRLLGPVDHRPISLRSSLKTVDGTEVYVEQLVLGGDGNDLFVPPADLGNDPAFVRIEGGPGFDLLELPFESGNALITTDAYGVHIIPNDSSLPTFLVSGSTDAIRFSDQQVTFDSLIQSNSNLTTQEDEPLVVDWVPAKFGENLADRITLDEPPSHGDLRLFADGGLAYQPDPDYAGEDSFSYRYQVPAINAPFVDGVNQDIISGDLETWLPWLSLEQFSPALVDGQEYAFQFHLVDLATSDADLHVQLDNGKVLIADELTSPILESTADNTLTFRFTKASDIHAIQFAPLLFGPTPAASISINGIKLLDVATGSLILDKVTRPGPRHTVRMQILPVADPPLVSVQPITTREDQASSFSFVAKAIDVDGSESVHIQLSGLPIGAQLSDGSNQFDANAVHHSVNLSDWDLSNLTIVPPEDIGGDFSLELKVTSIDSAESEATTRVPVDYHIQPVADGVQLITNNAAGEADRSIQLDIQSRLLDQDGSETQTIYLTGLPPDSVLSAGLQLDATTWQLTESDLIGLIAKTPTVGQFTVSVQAEAQETNGDVLVTNSEFAIQVSAPVVVPTDDTPTTDEPNENPGPSEGSTDSGDERDGSTTNPDSNTGSTETDQTTGDNVTSPDANTPNSLTYDSASNVSSSLQSNSPGDLASPNTYSPPSSTANSAWNPTTAPVVGNPQADSIELEQTSSSNSSSSTQNGSESNSSKTTSVGTSSGTAHSNSRSVDDAFSASDLAGLTVDGAGSLSNDRDSDNSGLSPAQKAAAIAAREDAAQQAKQLVRREAATANTDTENRQPRSLPTAELAKSKERSTLDAAQEDTTTRMASFTSPSTTYVEAFQTTTHETIFDSQLLAEELDQLTQEMLTATDMPEVVVGTAVVFATGFSAVQVALAVRSTVLVTHLMSSVPTWATLDPLPVLQANRGSYANDNATSESLADIASNTARKTEP